MRQEIGILDKPKPTPAKRMGLSSDTKVWILCLTPSLLLLVALFAYPLAYSFWLSLTNYDILHPIRFVGLYNYLQILSDPNVWHSLQVTFSYGACVLAIELVGGFILALLLQRITRGRGVYRALLLLPLMMTPVITGINLRLMLNYDFGVINAITMAIGLGRHSWALESGSAFPVLVAAEVWHSIGFVVLILSAGLATMPTEPFEAADVDGASWWQKLWYLTLPMLQPLFLVILVFRSYNLIRQFDVVYTLTGGGPGRETETLSVHIYNRMFSGWQIGYSAAISYVMLAVCLVIALAIIRSMNFNEER